MLNDRRLIRYYNSVPVTIVRYVLYKIFDNIHFDNNLQMLRGCFIVSQVNLVFNRVKGPNKKRHYRIRFQSIYCDPFRQTKRPFQDAAGLYLDPAECCTCQVHMRSTSTAPGPEPTRLINEIKYKEINYGKLISSNNLTINSSFIRLQMKFVTRATKTEMTRTLHMKPPFFDQL